MTSTDWRAAPVQAPRNLDQCKNPLSTTLAIAHWDGKHAILDAIAAQNGSPPFDPRAAVIKFANL
jgi:hypothetical protein